MKSKIFSLSTNKYGYVIKLKVEFNDIYIFTSWMHGDTNKFTNKREFNVSKVNEAFNSLKPVLSLKELIYVENFMFKKPEGTQMSLF